MTLRYFILLALLLNANLKANDNFTNPISITTTTTTRQGSVLDWLVTIIFPTTTTGRPSIIFTTTPDPTVERQCEPCICGISYSTRRIVGGQATQEHQYPWISMILIHNRFYCGAALISDRHVATAAHCVQGIPADLISLRFLEHNRRNSSAAVIQRNVTQVQMHEEYNRRTYDNDIALIGFAEPLNITGLLHPICLPLPNKSFANENAVVAGWGTLSEGGYLADELQEVNVTVLTQTACRQTSYKPNEITENMLCAGFIEDGGKDACQGDSGGPLQVLYAERPDQYQLVGIVSWGSGCARPNAPGVYTRVSQYQKWIEKHTIGDCFCEPNVANAEMRERI